ncbi:MAG: hypothetical protein F4Z40_04740 [Chloroflexi bacterium]|nr:hypothetical protein [Chloroflexota bacterium]
MTPAEDPGRAVAFFLRVDPAVLAELGSRPLRATILRGGIAALAGFALTYLLLATITWIVLGGFAIDVSPVTILGTGTGPLVAAWLGALLALPLVRALTPHLPGLAALAAYALPGAALLSSVLIWAALARVAIVTAWGDTTRPWLLSDLQSLLGREEQLWAAAFAAALAALLLAIPLWLRIWLRLSPAPGAANSRFAPASPDLLAYHDRVRATRVEAGEFSQRPRADLPALAGRDDISVVERDSSSRMPSWLAATAGANSMLGKPAVALFLICLLLRAFLTDPGLERFPSNDTAVFFLDGLRSSRTLTVPLGPEVSGVRIFALSGSGVVDVFVPALFEREPDSFSFLRAAETDPLPSFDVDLAGAEAGRGEIVLRNRWPGSVRLELRALQQFDDGELAVAVVLAVASALLIVSGAVLAVLGFANLRSYLSG